MNKYHVIITMLCMACPLFSAQAQQLVPVDELSGRYGNVNDVDVSQDGARFYNVDGASDSIIVNGQFFPLPPRAFTFPIGKPYSISVNGDGSVGDLSFMVGNVTILTDSSRLVFTSLYGDTLHMQDTFYVNAADGNGANLLLRELHFDGNTILNSKQWHSTFNCSYRVTEAAEVGGNIFFCGIYAGNEGGMLLDGHFLDIGSGNGNAFMGAINGDYEVVWLESVSGLGYDTEERFAINQNGHILLAGTSSSSYAHYCDDYLVNQAVVHWGSDFLYLVQFDTLGNCINAKTVDYYYGSVLSSSISSLPDGSYIISGDYHAPYLGFDSMYLHNPGNNSQIGFLAKLSDGLEPQALFQLEGSQGTKSIRNMAIDKAGNILICGYASVDTLIIGNEVLVDSTGNSSIGYMAVLDSDFNVVSAMMTEGSGRKLLLGNDDQMYLLTGLAVNHHKLFRVGGLPTGIGHGPERSPAPRISVHPNPLEKGGQVHYRLSGSPGETLVHLNLYDLYGQQLMSGSPNGINGALGLGGKARVFIMEFITSENRRIAKKIVVN